MSFSSSSSHEKPGELRPLNVLHDIPSVAELINICFHKNIGDEEIRHQLRTNNQKKRLSWSSNAIPLKGFVWQEQKKIVGNISIIPFRKEKKEIILLANIAVHPDYRRKGIARKLTKKGIEYAHQHGAESIWLHAEDDNLGVIRLYKELGFQSHNHRTTWVAKNKLQILEKHPSTLITHRPSQFWDAQDIWLNRSYPQEITWYKMPDWQIFKPGFRHWLYRFFVESDVRQWAAQKDGELQAILMWTETHARRAPIWLATAPQADARTLSDLLLHARLHLKSRKRTLTIDYPAGELTTAFEEAGFTSLRTLLWMKIEGQK